MKALRAYIQALRIRYRMRARCDHMEFVVENLIHGKILMAKLEADQKRDQANLWALEQPKSLMGSRVRA